MTAFLDRVGGAPISWGVCEAPGWGLQLPVDRVLAEARALGITTFEQGALGWLPTDVAAQRAKLDEYGMTLLGGFVPLVLHDPERRAATLISAAHVAAMMRAAGGRHFVTAVVADVENWHRPPMTAAAWTELFANLARVDQICAANGLVQVVHPHVDTLIETVDDVARFVDGCAVGLCFDTGHLTVGGADVVGLAADLVERVGLVHLKDVDGDVARRLVDGEFGLMAATKAGLFPPLGDGSVGLAEVIDVLEGRGYSGWYVIETDVALTDEPPVGSGPAIAVERSLAYLRSLDLSGARR